MPIMMVVINDVMAYMFGFFFGRTPLIQLSPKKTWEGFIGGGVGLKKKINFTKKKKIQKFFFSFSFFFSDFHCHYCTWFGPFCMPI